MGRKITDGMKVLGIETSTYSESLAVVEDDIVLAEFSLNNGSWHSEKLLPMIEWLLKEAGIDKKKLDGIAISMGPGSFTPLRIGISTAKGIAFSLGIPVVGISSLEVLAWNLLFTPLKICSIIDAKKGEVFAAFFKSNDGNLRRESEDILCSPQHIYGMINERTVFIGSGALLYKDYLKDSLGERAMFCSLNFNLPRVSNCALLGAKMLKNGYRDNVSILAPQYLKRAEAEISKGR